MRPRGHVREVVIGAGPGIDGAGTARDVAALRRRIAGDEARLAALAPGSAAHRQVRRRLGRGRAELRGLRARRRRSAREMRDAGLFFILVGGIVGMAAQGSWWVLLGLGQALVGVAMMRRSLRRS